MEELHQFEFGTIVCDGCGCRFDSNFDDECIHSLGELLDDELDQHEWEEQPEDKWYCPECVQDPTHRKHPGEGRIIGERMTLSGIRCDHCGKKFVNLDGYSLWEDYSYAKEQARDGDWRELDGKMLCEDCYRDCLAVEHEDKDGIDFEEKFCSKCPHKDNCNETVGRDVPDANHDCEYAVRTMDEDNQRVKYEKCPYYESNPPFRARCNLPEGERCPRIVAWEIERKEVEANNKEVLEWVKGKGENK